MRRYLSTLLGLTLAATPLEAQGLRDKISQLFIFADGKDPLFLGGTAGSDSATALHADHFVPSAVSDNGTLISFIGTAISQNVANIPVSATSGGSTFHFEGGAPVRTSVSPGPVFAERAQTLGRGRVFVGANVSRQHFESLRGVSLNDIQMTFTHENVTGPDCDALVGASCDPYGVPTHENDVIALRLALDIDMTVTSFFVSFGLLDRVDIGVVLPIVSSSLRGTSDAQIIPFGGTTAQHFFGGTPDNPVLTTSRFVEGSATGIGDVAARVKVSITQSERTTFALLGDVRFPTGSEDDLLGSGHLAARGLGILSARFEFATGSGVMPVANALWPLDRGGLRPNVVWTAGLEYNF